MRLGVWRDHAPLSHHEFSPSFALGPLKGLTLIAQGSNLSNKTFITYQNNDPRQVLTWESYGRRYEIGVSYKFQ